MGIKSIITGPVGGVGILDWLKFSTLGWGAFGAYNWWLGYPAAGWQLAVMSLGLLLVLAHHLWSERAQAHLFLLTQAAGLLAVSTHTGGSLSSSVWLFCLAPQLSNLLLGRRQARTYTLLASLSLVAVYLSTNPAQAGLNSAHQALLMQGLVFSVLLWLTLIERRDVERNLDLLHKRELDLERARDEALKASRARQRFLATMSHEIRTPLNGILGATELLQLEPNESERDELLSTLANNGRHLLGIVNDILDFARYESAKPSIRLSSVDLEEIAENVLSSCATLPGAQALELLCEAPEGAPRLIMGDPLRLEQILRNLVSNAIKFTPQGSVVVRLLEEQGRCLVQVVDSGSGIAEDHLPRLFQPFEMLEEETKTRRVGGTGLGLAISQRLAQAMQGSISVESELGVGSTFQLSLPNPVRGRVPPTPRLGPQAPRWQAIGFPAPSLARLSQLAAELGVQVGLEPCSQRLLYPQMPKPLTRANLMRIFRPAPSRPQLEVGQLFPDLEVLIVDDNAINRRVTAGLLHKLQCRVSLAKSGSEALLLAQEHQFHLVLMDLHMPEMDGVETINRLRQQGYAGSVAAFTADVLPEARQAFAEVGVTRFLLKPASLQDLSQCLTFLQDSPSVGSNRL